jgi:dTDP-4-amino-4,6-dideoxygalactose transaminase
MAKISPRRKEQTSMQPIKMVDLHRQYQKLKPELEKAIQAVLDSTEFIMGKAVRGFEADLSRYLKVPCAIGCASGTDALLVAMMALGIGPGDEVITTPFTFVATIETLVLLGARPVFVDIDPGSYNLDPASIPQKITRRTKAILPVHLYGHPADMAAILALAHSAGLKVIEDAAQAIGARCGDAWAGTLGDLGCLSFFPSKNLGAYGDGGAVVCSDPLLAERLRMIINHGSRARYHHELLGVNSRLDTLQAAILQVKLQYLEEWTAARIQIAQKYQKGLVGLDLLLPSCAPGLRHVYNQYSIRTSKRNALADFLKNKGIATAVHYPKPLHLQPAYREICSPDEHFPVAEAVAQEILSLPIFPEMKEAEVEYVIASIREFFADGKNF